MTQSSLSQAVDQWTAEVMVASGYLVRLYRILGDDRQAFMAVQAQGPSAERVQRLGFGPRVQALHNIFVAEHPEDAIGEQKAWELVLAAQAGLCAIHVMVDEHEKGGSLRGPRTATTKAFHKSLLGYRAAFPEEMTIPIIHRSIETAAMRCAESFALNVDETTDHEKAELRREIHANILDALMKEAGVGLA
jgi:hypothetical protein